MYATGKCTGMLAPQVRGSIPLYWGQDVASMSPVNPKPAIQLQHNDPHFLATRLHFQVHVSPSGVSRLDMNSMLSMILSAKEVALCGGFICITHVWPVAASSTVCRPVNSVKRCMRAPALCALRDGGPKP